MKSTKLSSLRISIPVVSGALPGGCLTNKNIKTTAAEDPWKREIHTFWSFLIWSNFMFLPPVTDSQLKNAEAWGNAFQLPKVWSVNLNA